MMDKSDVNQKHMKNANCVQEFVSERCSKCLPFARTYAWRRLLHHSTAVSTMTWGNRTIPQLNIPVVR